MPGYRRRMQLWHEWLLRLLIYLCTNISMPSRERDTVFVSTRDIDAPSVIPWLNFIISCIIKSVLSKHPPYLILLLGMIINYLYPSTSLILFVGYLYPSVSTLYVLSIYSKLSNCSPFFANSQNYHFVFFLSFSVLLFVSVTFCTIRTRCLSLTVKDMLIPSLSKHI